MKNYCTETDLKYYFPELDNYKWAGMSDFSGFITGAENKVGIDIKNKGYDLRKLQTELVLKSGQVTAIGVTDSVEDKANRLRLVYDCTDEAIAVGNIFILQGSNDDENWNNVLSVTIPDVSEHSVCFVNAYKYYRLSFTVVAGAPSHRIFLVETNYDILFCYKALEHIMMNGSKEENDKYWIKMVYFKEMYDAQLNSMVISIDADDDGEIEDSEAKQSSGVATYVR